MVPKTHYTLSGDLNIAYQVYGEGSVDIIFVGGFLSQVEHLWEEPSVERFFKRIGTFARLILYDRRGVGLSDRLIGSVALEDEVGDLAAVLDATGSQRAAILGYAGGAALSVLMADRHPERVAALVLYAAIMRNTAAADYEWARSPEERRAAFEEMIAGWGDADNAGDFAPSMAGDERFRQWMARLQRLSASPGTVAAMVEASQEIDVRSVLPTLEVPTLVMHRSGDRVIDVRHSQFAAQQIPGARYVELEGIDNLPSAGDSESIVHEIEEFLTGGRTGSEAERALLTVMFTDIVDSTTRAAELGDRRWRDVLAGHDAIVRKELDRFDGQEVKTIGDGFLAVFGGAPTRAVQCARAIASATNETGCAIRAGLHTGECELIGDDVGGMAVHLAARVSAMAQPGEILVSGTLHDAVLGSPVTFEPRGAHTLKGVPGEWPVYAVTGTG